MEILTYLFFISFCFNIFIIIYTIYSFVEIIFLQELQGSKLKIKQNQIKF